MAPLFFFNLSEIHPGVSSLNSRHLSVVFAYGHTTLSTPDLVRSRKLSRVGAWLVLGWEDRLGIPGAVSFCFSFTGQLTHFSKLQHSCVLLYPFNLIAASFLPFDFSVTSFCFRCDKRQLSLFVLHFSSRGR